MTLEEWTEHADNLSHHLDAKRVQLQDADLVPCQRAHLIRQINALADRVEDMRLRADQMRAAVSRDCSSRA